MSRGLLGKKLGMTAFYSSEGRLVPVTVVEAGPCVVTQIKTLLTDGYNALEAGKVLFEVTGHGRVAGPKEFLHDSDRSFVRDQRIDAPLPGQASFELSRDTARHVADRCN